MHPLSRPANPGFLPRLRATGLGAGLAGWLLLLSPRTGHAEDAVSYKYEDYSEANGRIRVTTQSALYEQDLGTDMHLKLHGIIDAIAGATPNGQPAPAGSDQVVLSNLHDRRKAWDADFSRQFHGFSVDVGLANSRESDYVSTGWSVNTQVDFNRKNTTLLAGVAGTDDDIKVFYQTPWARKRTNDFILGVTQLLDPQTTVTFNVSTGQSTGYLSDQYKVVQKTVQLAPGVFLPFTYGENRPDHRTKWVALAAVNHAFLPLNAAIEASYRFYHDTFGTTAHTVELSWFQHLGAKFVLSPSFRFYAQDAADFYHYQLDQTGIVPVAGRPPVTGPFYSSDYRLSELHSYTYGLKAVWTVTDRWQLDAEFNRYDMHGTDGVTPESAYPRANIVTAGVKFSW